MLQGGESRHHRWQHVKISGNRVRRKNIDGWEWKCLYIEKERFHHLFVPDGAKTCTHIDVPLSINISTEAYALTFKTSEKIFHPNNENHN